MSVDTTVNQRIFPTGSDISDVSLAWVDSAKFDKRVETLREQETTEDLRTEAKKLIEILAADVEHDKLTVGTSTLQLHRVLVAMLEHAFEAGGDDGVKYCAASISACARSKDGADMTVSSLRELANIWVSRFLYPFKAPYPRKTQKNKSSSKATMILERDGHECTITGAMGKGHPSVTADPSHDYYVLECAHILRRAVAEVGESGSKQFNHSTVQCFDILRNYCGFSESVFDRLDEIIDHPANAFMLWQPVHSTFHKFYWTLVPHESGPNRYKVKKLDTGASLIRVAYVETGHGPAFASDLEFVEFMDHRLELAKLNNENPLPCAIDLPNPLFFKIHATVAGILKTSGAGEFFDEVLEKYEQCKNSS